MIVTATGREQVPVIELTAVEMRYAGPPPLQALRDCSVRIWPGEYVAIQGKSGSGKTTLLNIVGLLDRPTGGSYRLTGIDTSDLREVRRTALRAVFIGFVFQAFHLLPHRTALENVELALMYNGAPRSARTLQAAEALAAVGLAGRMSALPTMMSGGERQRVAVARALVNRPKLLLCDEPTGNLDSATADEIMKIIGSLNAAGQTIVLITHDQAVAARAGRILTISDGVLSENPAGNGVLINGQR